MVDSVDPSPTPSFEEAFAQGQGAFDRGQYRQSMTAFETAIKLAPGGSKRGGEAQLWLAMAYQAAGDMTAAKTLCRKLIRHPHPEVRKQSQQVLAILQAPQLARPPEWMTPIPDLSRQENDQPARPIARRRSRPKPPPSPIQFEDTSRMNTQDNGFVFVAIAVLLVLLGLTLTFS